MGTLDNAIVASFERDGKRFELYVDPEPAYAYVEGKKSDIKNILVSEEVYENARKGEKQKSEFVQKVFGTTDIFKILEFVLKNGQVQLTTEQRKKKTEEKRKQIIAILLRESIDPRTNAPHTQIRIENALEQAGVLYDPFKDPREQLNEIVKKLRPIIPLKFEKVRFAVKIPAAFSNKCYGTLKSYGIIQEEWGKDGSFISVVEIFGGMQGEFFDKINKMTNGSVETKLLKT